MPTQLQQLRKDFLNSLATELAVYGFKRRGWDYYRKTSYGKDIIKVDFVAHPGVDFEVNLSMWLRHDSVEDLINAFNTRFSEKAKLWTATVGNRLDNYLGRFTGDDISWSIASDEDLGKVIPGIMTTIKEIVFPFFERFSSLEEVLNVTSGDDREASRYCLMEHVRAKKAVASAFVLGKREVFDELAERKLEYLKEVSKRSNYLQDAVPEFIVLVEGLRERWDDYHQPKE